MGFTTGLGAPTGIGLPAYFANPDAGNNICFNCFIFTVDTTKYSAPAWWYTWGVSVTESLYDNQRDPSHASYMASPNTVATEASSSAVQFRLPFQNHASGLGIIVDWGDDSSSTISYSNTTEYNALVSGNNFLHTYSSGDTYTITVKPLPTITAVYAAATNSTTDGSSQTLAIDDGSENASAANDTLFLNKKVYKSDGTLFGTCSGVTTTQLSFATGLSATITDNDRLYVYDGTERIKGWQTDTTVNASTPNLSYSRVRDGAKIMSIEQWGAFDFSTTHTFTGCRYMAINAGDVPYISTTSFYGTFACCETMNADLNSWPTSNITTFEYCFFDCINFNGDLSTWDTGSLTGTGLNYTFAFANSFNRALDYWDVSGCTSLNYTFLGAYNFNQDINSWDVSNVTTMIHTFSNYRQRWQHSHPTGGRTKGPDVFHPSTIQWYQNREYITGTYNQHAQADGPGDGTSVTSDNSANTWTTTNGLPYTVGGQESYHNWRRYDFNQPLNNWDVSKVTSFNGMFYHAVMFNQNIDDWTLRADDTAIDMSYMFSNTYMFNQPLNSWNVEDVTNFTETFGHTHKFNQPLGDWDVRKATIFKGMFKTAQAFNQADINDWTLNLDTSAVSKSMEEMFYECPSFNQSLNDWDMSKVTTMKKMFAGNHYKVDANEYSYYDYYLHNSYSGFNNANINEWVFPLCTDMSYMFYNNTVFNQGSIGGADKWDTGDVVLMDYMFGGGGGGTSPGTFSDGTTNNAAGMQCIFNKDITEWDTSSVTSMTGMFQHTKYFNQDIGTNGDATVVGGGAFDYTFGGTIDSSTQGNDYANTTKTDDYWDVSAVDKQSLMFWGADAFQLPLSDWDVNVDGGSTSAGYDYSSQGDMFLFSAYNQANYDLLLVDWDGQAVEDNNNFGISTRYTKGGVAQAARHNLIKDHNWRFHDSSKTNYSIHFDGVNDYLTASATPVFGQVKYSDTESDPGGSVVTNGTLTNGAGATITSNSSPGDWSMTFFFKVDALDSSKQVLFHFGAGADDIEFHITIDNELRFESGAWQHTYEDANGDTAATISAGTWYSVIYAVNRNDKAYWYINGASPIWKDISGVTHVNYTSSGTSLMGKDDSGNYFEGNIDLVYIYYGYLNVAAGLAAVAAGGEWDGRVINQPNNGDRQSSAITGADGVYPAHSWLMGDNRTWTDHKASSPRIYPTAQGPKLWNGSAVVIPHNVWGTTSGYYKYHTSYTQYPEYILGTSSDGNIGSGISWTSSGMTATDGVCANIETDTPDY